MNQRVSPVLLTAIGAMAVVLAGAWLLPGPTAAWRQWSAPAAQPPNLDDVKAAELTPNPAAAAAYPVVLERPLLNPARRPQAAASAASAPAAAAPPLSPIEQMKLRGMIDGAALNGVLIEEGDKARFVKLGDKVGDWTLDHVRGRIATFKRGTETKDIELPRAWGTQEKGVDAAQPAATPPAVPAPVQAPAPPPAAPKPPVSQPAQPLQQTPLGPMPSTKPTDKPGGAAPSRGGFGGGGQRASNEAPR